MAGKFLTEKEIREYLRPRAEEIVDGINDAMKEGVNTFYKHHTPSSYDRHQVGFRVFNEKAEKRESGRGWDITAHYDASEVNVNRWAPPYMNKRNDPLGNGLTEPFIFEGSPEWAFNADFVNGYHGGSIPSYGGGWTWSGVEREEESPWDHVSNYLEKASKKK